MSLQKWKDLAQRKSELGKKINFVNNVILENKLGERVSEESYAKVFRPITKKLDEASSIEKFVKKINALGEEGVDGLDPEKQKQIPPKPPSYAETMRNIYKQYISDDGRRGRRGGRRFL